jgi:formylmethanofuran dehydrogenase subunit B
MMAKISEDPTKPDPHVVEDATCLGCGCLCDDISLRIEGDRLVGADGACALGESWFLNRPAVDRPACLVGGHPATVEAGIERAAGILLEARYPLIFGLSETNSEAQRLVVAIADGIGGCIGTTPALDRGSSTIAFQEVGEVTCTLGEVKNRADLILLWGCNPAETHPRLFERYSLTSRGLFRPRGRSDRYGVVIDDSRTATAAVSDEFIPIMPGRHFEVLWTLRALVKGVDLDPGEIEAQTGVPLPTWQALLNRMIQAKYGVIFHGGRSGDRRLGHLDHHALFALVRKLNDRTRFVTLHLQAGGNPTGAETVITSQTGYPSPVNLARGYPRYGPGEFDACTTLERGEPDAALIVAGDSIAGLSPAAREHLARIPTIVLEPLDTPAARAATVTFHTARHGIHASGTCYRMDGVPIPLRPAVASALPSDEDILRRLDRHVLSIRRSPAP